MKITVSVNAKEFEKTNYILSKCLDSLSGNEKAKIALGITDNDISNAVKFRRQLVDGFIASTKPIGEKARFKPKNQ